MAQTMEHFLNRNILFKNRADAERYINAFAPSQTDKCMSSYPSDDFDTVLENTNLSSSSTIVTLIDASGGVGQTYTLNFSKDDVTKNDNIIYFPAGSVSISNTDFADGLVILKWNDGSSLNDATVTITGLTYAQELEAYSVSQIDVLFGANTIVHE